MITLIENLSHRAIKKLATGRGARLTVQVIRHDLWGRILGSLRERAPLLFELVDMLCNDFGLNAGVTFFYVK